MKAAKTWAAQLSQNGCQTDLFTLHDMAQSNGQPVNDLNDAIHTTRPGLLTALFP